MVNIYNVNSIDLIIDFLLKLERYYPVKIQQDTFPFELNRVNCYF